MLAVFTGMSAIFRDRNENSILRRGDASDQQLLDRRGERSAGAENFQLSPVLPEDTATVLFPALFRPKTKKKKNERG